MLLEAVQGLDDLTQFRFRTAGGLLTTLLPTLLPCHSFLPSVVLVDERLFFDVQLFVAVVLMLFRAKVFVVLPLFFGPFRGKAALETATHQLYFAAIAASSCSR